MCTVLLDTLKIIAISLIVFLVSKIKSASFISSKLSGKKRFPLNPLSLKAFVPISFNLFGNVKEYKLLQPSKAPIQISSKLSDEFICERL